MPAPTPPIHRPLHRRLVTGALLALAALLTAALALHSASLEGPTPSPSRPQAPSQSPSPVPPLPKVERPTPQQPPVGAAEDSHLDKTPPRATKGLDLIKSGWTYNCMECHKLLPAQWHYDDRPLVEHKNIQLQHGENRFCLNCHHPTNRNAFVDYDGAEIAQANVVSLCAKCHGTIHRDWVAGVHGRENGYWKADLGPKTKLRCIQCHDPHSPKFKAIAPLPPLKYPARGANPPTPGKATPSAHP